VGVFAAFASHAGYALVDTRLFVPEPWLSDAYALRSARCKVPEELTFQTKPQLAGAMVRGLSQGGILPFKYVVADCLDGNSPDFLEALEACRGLTYRVAMRADTRCWLQGLVREHKPYGSKGEAMTKRTVAHKDNHPPSVEAIAKGIHGGFWYRRPVSEGTKGPIDYEFTKRRIILCRAGRTGRCGGDQAESRRAARLLV
jgi:SRSO17 transposase